MPSEESSLRDLADRMIREQLEHPANLRDLIAAVAPELVGGFDFGKVEKLEREFTLSNWRRRVSDLLFLIPHRGDELQQPVLVCVLVEHQSRPDPLMPLRMFLYMAYHGKGSGRNGSRVRHRGRSCGCIRCCRSCFTPGRPFGAATSNWRT